MHRKARSKNKNMKEQKIQQQMTLDEMIELVKMDQKIQMAVVKAEADAAIKALKWAKNSHNILHPYKKKPT